MRSVLVSVLLVCRRPTAIQPDFQMRPSVVRLNVQGDPEVAASTAATTEKSRLQRLGRMFSLRKQKTDPNRLAPIKYLGVNGGGVGEGGNLSHRSSSGAGSDHYDHYDTTMTQISGPRSNGAVKR